MQQLYREATVAQPGKAHHLEAVQPGGWPTEFVLLVLGRAVNVSLVTDLISPDLKGDSNFHSSGQ